MATYLEELQKSRERIGGLQPYSDLLSPIPDATTPTLSTGAPQPGTSPVGEQSLTAPLQPTTAAPQLPPTAVTPDTLPTPQQDRAPGLTYLKDIGKQLGAGVTMAGQGIYNLLDLGLSGGLDTVGEALTGTRPSQFLDESIKSIRQSYSPATKGSIQNITEADGFWNTVGATLTNPRGLLSMATESVPLMAGGMGLARLAGQAAVTKTLATGATQTAAAKAGQVAAQRATMATTAALSAGFAGAQARQKIEDMSPDELMQNPDFQELLKFHRGDFEAAKREMAISAGQTTMPIAGLIGAAAGRIVAPFEAGVVMGTGAGGLARTVGTGVAREGTEEAIQEGLAEQMGANIGVAAQGIDQPIFEGVPEAMGVGFTVGGAMGGGLGGLDYAARAIRDRQRKPGTALARPEGYVEPSPPPGRDIARTEDTAQILYPDDMTIREYQEATRPPPAPDSRGLPGPETPEIAGLLPESGRDMPIQLGPEESIYEPAARVIGRAPIEGAPGALRAPAAPAAPQPEAPEPRGRQVMTSTPDEKTKFPTKYEVVDASELVVSNDPESGAVNENYPRALQPRDRDRAENMEQVRDIARNLNPARLMEAATSDAGAPIIGPDRVVESGNGRSMALKLAYQGDNPGAQAYRAKLRMEASRFGLTPEQVESVPNPVLVRQRTEDIGMAERVKLARSMGASPIAGVSTVESAQTDATEITADMLAKMGNEGVHSPDFLRDFFATLPRAERAQAVNKQGLPSRQGIERAEAAIFQVAYASPELTELYREAVDPDSKSLVAALGKAAPAVARARTAGPDGAALADDIEFAVQNVRMAKRSKLPIKAYLESQTDLFTQPNARQQELSLRFSAKINAPAQLGALITEVADAATTTEQRAATGDLFGGEADVAAATDSVLERTRDDTDTQLRDVDGAAVPGEPAQEIPAGQVGEQVTGQVDGERLSGADQPVARGTGADQREAAPDVAGARAGAPSVRQPGAATEEGRGAAERAQEPGRLPERGGEPEGVGGQLPAETQPDSADRADQATGGGRDRGVTVPSEPEPPASRGRGEAEAAPVSEPSPERAEDRGAEQEVSAGRREATAPMAVGAAQEGAIPITGPDADLEGLERAAQQQDGEQALEAVEGTQAPERPVEAAPREAGAAETEAAPSVAVTPDVSGDVAPTTAPEAGAVDQLVSEEAPGGVTPRDPEQLRKLRNTFIEFPVTLPDGEPGSLTLAADQAIRIQNERIEAVSQLINCLRS